MPEKESLFILDCDDFLWMNCWQYDKSYNQAIGYLYKIFGDMMPPWLWLNARILEIESEKANFYGVKRGRVAASMVQLYEEVSNYANENFGFLIDRHEHKKKLSEIGDQPFDYTVLRWRPGIKETLRELKNRGHELRFFPSYDPDLFRKRIEFMGLYEFASFENCDHTVFKKTVENFVKISGWSKESDDKYSRWYACGNGRNDVITPLDLSNNWWGAIVQWGSTSPWFHGEQSRIKLNPDPIDHPRVHDLKQFSEIFNYI